jgi:hypothetical protein
MVLYDGKNQKPKIMASERNGFGMIGGTGVGRVQTERVGRSYESNRKGSGLFSRTVR